VSVCVCVCVCVWGGGGLFCEWEVLLFAFLVVSGVISVGVIHALF